MGLFSGKTKTYVSSTSLNLMEEPANAVAEATLYAILSGASIPEVVNDNISSGLASKIRKAYKYGLNTYTLRLPTGRIGGVTQVASSIIKNIIEAELIDDYGIAIIYSFIGTLAPELAASEYLSTHRVLNRTTNVVQSHSFSLSHQNTQPLTFSEARHVAATNSIELTYSHSYQDSSAEPTYNYDGDLVPGYITEIFIETIPVPTGLIIGETYCMAAYYKLDSSGAVLPTEYFWFYRLATGVYPQLTLNTTEFGSTAYLPIVPLRRDNTDLTVNKNTELYITSKKLLKMLSVDIDNIATKINENPDVGEIDHAYIMFGIDIQTKHEPSIRYLCEYFDYMYANSIYFEADHQNVPQAEYQVFSHKFNRSLIQLQEYGLDIGINYNYITSTVITGSIGSVGTATSQTIISTTPYIIFRLQLTPRTYKQVTVYGLAHTNNIYNGYTVITNLTTSLESDNHNLIIPVHYGIANNLPSIVKNRLYYDSFRIILNSYKVQKLKWYQSSFFKFLFIIVAIVVVIITRQVWLANLLVAAKAGMVALLMYILPELLVGIAVSMAIKYAVKKLGAKLSIYLAAIIAVVAVISYNSQAFIDMMQGTLPSAQTLLSLSSSILQASNDLIQGQVGDIYAEIGDFQADAEKKWDILEAAQKLLDTGNNLNPMQMISPFKSYIRLPTESPDAFYDRTIHTGNIGVLTLDTIESYTGLMLKLPEAKYV